MSGVINLRIQHRNSSEPMAEWRVPFWDIDIGDVIFVDGKLFRIIAGIPDNLVDQNKMTAVVDNYVSEGIL